MSTQPIKSAAPRHAGFTMIELLVAIGIMIILMGITLPMIGAIGRGTGQANTMNEISASMTAARAVAMKEGRDTAVIFRGTRGGGGTGPMQAIIAIRNNDTTAPGFEPYESRGPVLMPNHNRIAGVTSMGINPTWVRPGSVDETGTTPWIGVCFGTDGRTRNLDGNLTTAAYYDEDESDAKNGTERNITFVPVLATYDAQTLLSGIDENSPAQLSGFINSELKDVDAQAAKLVRAVYFDSYTGQVLK